MNNTNTYAFFLGTFTSVSLAELFSVYGESYEAVDRDFVILDTKEEFTQKQLYPLGGTIKVAEVLFEGNSRDFDEWKLAEALVELLFPKATEDIKWRYAINTYGPPRWQLTKLLNYTKKLAKQKELSTRFVNKNLRKNISSVVVRKEKLIEKGADINICLTGSTVYITRTVASQDFQSYSDRDYGKPTRDMKGGIMPPKLAQMMLNIALGDQTEGMRVLDPFCGSGTLVMEGILQHSQMIGSDIDQEIIEKAKENIRWTLKEYEFRKPTTPEITVHDATKPFQVDPVDAIVSESYLGPTLHTMVSLKRQQEIFQDVFQMHQQFFRQAKDVLKPGGSIVMCFPFFNDNGRYRFMENLLEMVKALGYTTDVLLPQRLLKDLKWKENKRGSLLYARKEHLVGREIFKFIRT